VVAVSLVGSSTALRVTSFMAPGGVTPDIEVRPTIKESAQAATKS